MRSFFVRSKSKKPQVRLAFDEERTNRIRVKVFVRPIVVSRESQASCLTSDE